MAFLRFFYSMALIKKNGNPIVGFPLEVPGGVEPP